MASGYDTYTSHETFQQTTMTDRLQFTSTTTSISNMYIVHTHINATSEYKYGLLYRAAMTDEIHLVISIMLLRLQNVSHSDQT